MKQLDPRLQLVAQMVDRGRLLVDVGTDHAYLPVYLVEQQIVPRGIASDLRKGPLAHAQSAVTQAGLQEQIALRLSDGLDAIAPHEAECIVMAGMGGILITQLIEKAPWLQDATKTLVLQPMTDAPLLRSYLAEQGFAIVSERATQDKKHVYTVIKAVYDGNKHTLSPLQALVGGLDVTAGESERAFLQKEANALQKQGSGLTAAGKREEANQVLDLHKQLTQWMNGGEQ